MAQGRVVILPNPQPLAGPSYHRPAARWAGGGCRHTLALFPHRLTEPCGNRGRLGPQRAQRAQASGQPRSSGLPGPALWSGDPRPSTKSASPAAETHRDTWEQPPVGRTLSLSLQSHEFTKLCWTGPGGALPETGKRHWSMIAFSRGSWGRAGACHCFQSDL